MLSPFVKAQTGFVPPSLVCVYIIIYLQVKLNAKEKSILEKWQTGDLKLYNHYKHKFNKMVSKMLHPKHLAGYWYYSRVIEYVLGICFQNTIPG